MILMDDYNWAGHHTNSGEGFLIITHRPENILEKEEIMNNYTDTDRLNFLLKYIEIDDIGDETYVPGIVILNEELEENLTWAKNPDSRGQYRHLFPEEKELWTLRHIIDKAIAENSSEE